MTRSETRSKLANVLRCDIEEDLTCSLSLRKNSTWYHVVIIPEDIQNDHLRGQYERRADASRREKIAFQEYCNGSQDSGYESMGDAQTEFEEWIQEPLMKIMTREGKWKTLSEWYGVDVKTFQLKAKDDWEVVEADLDYPSFIQSMSLPKYIATRPEVTKISPDDIEVVEEEHNIHMAIHPTIVKYNGETCFLKLVAEGQEPAVKREIKMLADIQKKKLDIRCPRLIGVVEVPGGSKATKDKLEIMGFLLQIVPGCRPLSRMMTSEISQKQREVWAKEVARQVEVLHKAKMLWGDAKGDNFLVDEQDKLWIIDFGGSFTVGWVDPSKYGTQRGEDEAVKLIVDGIKDPDHCELVEEVDTETPSDRKRRLAEQGGRPKRVKR